MNEFQIKLIRELHDIALSLQKMSGRDKTTIVKSEKEPKTYADKYFARSTYDK